MKNKRLITCKWETILSEAVGAEALYGLVKVKLIYMEDQLSGKSTGLGVFVLSKTTKVVIGSNPIDSTNKPGANRLSDGSTPSSSTRR